MSAKERLQGLQAKLQECGVVDVKFFFSGSASTPLSQFAADAADVLQAYLDGHATILHAPKNSAK